MRYIRFLKTPRIINEKKSSKLQITCLITITSDLGDSFLPHDVRLSAELIHIHQEKSEEMDSGEEEVILWQAVQWKSGMRSLPITFPLSKSQSAWPVLVRVGVEPKSKFDEFAEMVEEQDWLGVVSAWSTPVDLAKGIKVSEKFVQRRFQVGHGNPIDIYEETGESIARHLWDAGITLASHIKCIIPTVIPKELFNSNYLAESKGFKRFQAVELGTGCGIVGLALAKILPHCDVVLTDLAEAHDIVERNLDLARESLQGTVQFKELDWEDELPEELAGNVIECEHCRQIDLVVAADCTYNADSSPALVNTIQRIAKNSPSAVIMIAMKKRHSSEDIFFDLMSEAEFETTKTLTYPLPGDEKTGEETVEMHMFRYNGKAVGEAKKSEECPAFVQC